LSLDRDTHNPNRMHTSPPQTSPLPSNKTRLTSYDTDVNYRSTPQLNKEVPKSE